MNAADSTITSTLNASGYSVCRVRYPSMNAATMVTGNTLGFLGLTAE